jgi:hypothetical protein
MTEHKLLFDEELLFALRDIGALLEYLGREPDARLQSCFGDTNVLKGKGKLGIRPPSKTYLEFLNRVSAIQSRINSSGFFSHEECPRADALTDAAFILWTRDFLSALSAPATPDSIRITNGYMKYRFEDGKGSNLDRYDIFAARTVTTVKWLLGYAMATAVLIVIISIFALAGRQILSARESALSRALASTANYLAKSGESDRRQD